MLSRKVRAYIREGLSRRRAYYSAKLKSSIWKDKIRAYMDAPGAKKLNLGCGGHILKGWINSDILDIQDEMVFIDVRDALPFGQDSLDYIFSEHLLEHLEYEEGTYLMSQCFRTLKTGGVLRISTPDLAFLIDVYENENTENHEYIDWAFDFYWPDRKKSKALALNYYLTSWGHKCIYDEELLCDTLSQVGFKDIHKVAIGKSGFQELQGLEKHGLAITEKWNSKESLIVEAMKP
jgi:predicted SAM-dependent methyltransferase